MKFNADNGIVATEEQVRKQEEIDLRCDGLEQIKKTFSEIERLKLSPW